MAWWQYLVWGLFGGAAVEGMEFSRAIRIRGTWPWRVPGEPPALAFAISVTIRLLVGGGLAVALGLSKQIIGVAGALTAGVAAPLILEQLTQQIPLEIKSNGTTGGGARTPSALKVPADPPTSQYAADHEAGEHNAV